MTVETVDSKSLELRMHLAARAKENIDAARPRETVASVQVQPAVRQAQAGTPAEESEKGRIIRSVI